MLVLLTSGFPLNANTDENILPTADAAVKAPNNGNKIFFCENNPIKKTEYNKPHMKPQDYMSKCKERTEGYSWGSRIYVLLWAPGFNTDPLKIDELGGDPTGANGLIKINTREGSSSLGSSTLCNQFIETGKDHGLFYGSIKLSGFKKAVNADGKMNYGGNRCEGLKSDRITYVDSSDKSWETGRIKSFTFGSQGVLDDGALRAEAGQDGAITMTFEYAENQIMSKTATHTWRIADLVFDKDEYTMEDSGKVTIKDLDGLRFPFDKKTGYQIHLYSDTDKGGVEVNAFWKPNFRGTPQMSGDYPVKITFIDPDRRESTVRELYYKSGGSEVELKVSPGDNIYAEYYDRTLPQPYSTEDKLLIKTIAKIVETSENNGMIIINPQEIVEKDNVHAKQFAFTKYTSGGEYLVSIWWDSWEWWTNQPTANSDNAINISIVDGMTEKAISNVSYNLNVLFDGTSLIEQENEHMRTDIVDLSIKNNGLIEVLLSDIGEATEPLKFKFLIDSDLQPNAPFTQISLD